jgi:putative hydrolase of the HAD superfamily
MTVLVLDCDGVVVLGHPEGGRWDKDVAREFGVSAERVQALFFKRHWPRIEIGAADLFEMLDAVWPELGARGTARAFVDYWVAHDSRLDRAVLAEVDAWRARGGKAYLATVQEHHRAAHLWDVLGLAAHFDGLFYSAALGAKKPDAAFYERVQAKLPVTAADEILFLDDRADNVAGAQAAGWRATLYTGIADLRRAIAAL